MGNKLSIKDEQYGKLYRNWDHLVSTVKEGGKPYETALRYLRAVNQDTSSIHSFTKEFDRKWLSDESMIIAWNVMAEVSEMAKAALPSECRIIATFSKVEPKRRYTVHKFLPNFHEASVYNYGATIVEFKDNGDWYTFSTPSENHLFKNDDLKEIVEEFQVKIDLDNPPAEWMFMLPDGRLIWVEKPKKSPDEILGECVRILAECERAIVLPGRFEATVVTEVVMDALFASGYPVAKDTWQNFSSQLLYAIYDNIIDWQKLHPLLVEIKSKYLKP